MRKNILIVVSASIALSLLLTACGSPAPTAVPVSATGAATDALNGNITISGAFALYPMMTLWANEFQKLHPKVTFDISAGGAGKGMTDALSNAVDIGMVSRSVTSEEESQGAYAVAVVKDAVFPVVNAQNPVINDLLAKGVSQDMFIKIFITGEINSTVADPKGKMQLLAEKYADGKQHTMDGISVTYPTWHFNARASNTEPLMRLNLEATTREEMERRRDEVLAVIRG